MDFNRLCKGCFREKPQADMVCPYCGFDESEYERNKKPEVLPVNTVLRGAYILGKSLGTGGFGITYLGWHINLDGIVAIKEFFPAGIVYRNISCQDSSESATVTLTSSSYEQTYEQQLNAFIKEARTLWQLHLPGVVQVFDCFEENHTAYIVMDYVRGQDLAKYLKQAGGRLSEESVLSMMHPLIKSLQELHDKGIIHRDISPDNLLLNTEGVITLIDFGAARAVPSGGGAVNSMTIMLKPGYAPMEQYNSRGKQGPWTDVYALCATMYRMLTGHIPEEPGMRADRTEEEDEKNLRKELEMNNVSPHTADVLIKGLQLRSRNRYQSMRELEEALYARETVNKPLQAEEPEKNEDRGEHADRLPVSDADISGIRSETVPQRSEKPLENHSENVNIKKKNTGIRLAALLAVAVILVTAAAGLYIRSQREKSDVETEAQITSDKDEDIASQNTSEEDVLVKSDELSEVFSKAENGDAEAQAYLGDCYFSGDGVNQDYSEAVKWYEKAAEQGNAEAQRSLGICYHDGYGVEQDYTEAVKWFEKAVDQGSIFAQNNLGYCYQLGCGFEQDYAEAVKWYEKAAEQGDATAMCNLGNCYFNGYGVEQSYTEAVKWYEKAAEQGSIYAPVNLGFCYELGQGVEQDYDEAAKWYKKGAELGDMYAQYYLGLYYECGLGVEEDSAEAVKWYEKSAEQGFSIAQYFLGECYEYGQGVEQDYAEAVKWYEKAAEQGYADAQAKLKELQ